MDYDQNNQYVSSQYVSSFICPYCETDFMDKDLFILHLKEQHPQKSQNIDTKSIEKLQKYKQEKTGILNL